MRKIKSAIILILCLGCSSNPVISSSSRIPTSSDPSGNSKSRVPEVLFHFGGKKNLLDDVQANGVPEKIWSKFIMTNQSSWGLLKYRQGLYGCSHPAFCAEYGDMVLQKPGAIPWFMMISLKAECRDPARVVLIDELPKDARMKKWFGSGPKGKFKNFASFISSCFDSDDGTYQSKMAQGSDPSAESPEPETACTTITNQFLTQTKIAVVFDDAVSESWYIRDRNCIAGIKGTPLDLLGIMANLDTYWRGSVQGYTDPEEGPGTFQPTLLFNLLAESLKDADTISEDLLVQLKANVGKSDLIIPAVVPIENPMAGDPLGAAAMKLLNKYEACRDKNLLPSFQDQAQQYLRVQNHGVYDIPPEYRELRWKPAQMIQSFLGKLEATCG